MLTIYKNKNNHHTLNKKNINPPLNKKNLKTPLKNKNINRPLNKKNINPLLKEKNILFFMKNLQQYIAQYQNLQNQSLNNSAIQKDDDDISYNENNDLAFLDEQKQLIYNNNYKLINFINNKLYNVNNNNKKPFFNYNSQPIILQIKTEFNNYDLQIPNISDDILIENNFHPMNIKNNFDPIVTPQDIMQQLDNTIDLLTIHNINYAILLQPDTNLNYKRIFIYIIHRNKKQKIGYIKYQNSQYYIKLNLCKLNFMRCSMQNNKLLFLLLSLLCLLSMNYFIFMNFDDADGTMKYYIKTALLALIVNVAILTLLNKIIILDSYKKKLSLEEDSFNKLLIYNIIFYSISFLLSIITINIYNYFIMREKKFLYQKHQQQLQNSNPQLQNDPQPSNYNITSTIMQVVMNILILLLYLIVNYCGLYKIEEQVVELIL